MKRKQLVRFPCHLPLLLLLLLLPGAAEGKVSLLSAPPPSLPPPGNRWCSEVTGVPACRWLPVVVDGHVMRLPWLWGYGKGGALGCGMAAGVGPVTYGTSCTAEIGFRLFDRLCFLTFTGTGRRVAL